MELSGPSSFRAPGSRRVGFRLGELDVSVRSTCPVVTADFERLYANHPRSDFPDNVVEIEVRQTRRTRFGQARYAVFVGHEAIGPEVRGRDALPFVEWGINFRIAAIRRDLIQFHAASLVKDGQGFIFPADSGSGKSTLAAALLARRWRYLSDEFGLIRPETLTLHAFPKALCIKSGAFQTLSDLGIQPTSRQYNVPGYKGRVAYVSPQQFGADVVGAPCPVRWVIFPSYVGEGAPRLRSVSKAQAVFRLARHAMNRSVHGAMAMDVISAIAARAQCLALEIGSLRETCDLLERLVTATDASP